MRREGRRCGRLPALQRGGHARQRRLRAAVAILAAPSCRFVTPSVNDELRGRCISRGPPGPRPSRMLLLPSPRSACHHRPSGPRWQITSPPAGPGRGAGAARRSRVHCQLPAGVLGPLQVAQKPPGPLWTPKIDPWCLAATPRGAAWGDLSDPSSRRDTPRKAPHRPLGGARGLGWRAGTARGRTAVARAAESADASNSDHGAKKRNMKTNAAPAAHSRARGPPNGV